MSDIISLLFDEYTKDLSASQAEVNPGNGEAQFQRLQNLVGDAAALDIWDAAVAEGAMMQEACFQMGLKAGLALARELRSL